MHLFTKFRFLLRISRAGFIQWALTKRIVSFTGICVEDDAPATIGRLLNELMLSKSPTRSMFILNVLQSLPEEALERSRLLAEYLKHVPGGDARSKLLTCRIVLHGCFLGLKYEDSEPPHKPTDINSLWRGRQRLTKNVPCPACEKELNVQLLDGEIPPDVTCRHCGIQFGYNDALTGVRDQVYRWWREAWIANDCRPLRGQAWRDAHNEIRQKVLEHQNGR